MQSVSGALLGTYTMLSVTEQTQSWNVEMEKIFFGEAGVELAS